jgi:predicted HTH domain antitoxin
MDGAIDLDTMVEIAGMERGEVLRLVRDLFESGVVDFRTEPTGG